MYKQHNGYDKFHNTNDEGRTINRGKAVYNADGTLQHLDVISPSRPGWHHHEWMNKHLDGSYEHGHGEHKNH